MTKKVCVLCSRPLDDCLSEGTYCALCESQLGEFQEDLVDTDPVKAAALTKDEKAMQTFLDGVALLNVDDESIDNDDDDELMY